MPFKLLLVYHLKSKITDTGKRNHWDSIMKLTDVGRSKVRGTLTSKRRTKKKFDFPNGPKSNVSLHFQQKPAGSVSM